MQQRVAVERSGVKLCEPYHLDRGRSSCSKVSAGELAEGPFINYFALRAPRRECLVWHSAWLERERGGDGEGEGEGEGDGEVLGARQGRSACALISFWGVWRIGFFVHFCVPDAFSLAYTSFFVVAIHQWPFDIHQWSGGFSLTVSSQAPRSSEGACSSMGLSFPLRHVLMTRSNTRSCHKLMRRGSSVLVLCTLTSTAATRDTMHTTCFREDMCRLFETHACHETGLLSKVLCGCMLNKEAHGML